MNNYTKSLVNSLTTEQKAFFNEEYSRQSKSILLAYLFWVLLGFHYIYLKNGWVQIFYWLTLGGMSIWALIDLFRIPGMVSDYNRTLANGIIQQAKTIYTSV